MANLVGADEALGLDVADLTPGAHLNISAGVPLTKYFPAELLTSDGRFEKALALDKHTWGTDRYRKAVLSEWQTQLDRLLDLGLRLTHLDSHHHTHLLEPLFPVALTLARRHGLAIRTRNNQQRSMARREGVRTPDCLIEGFFGVEALTRGNLLSLLDTADGEVLEVMCHPGKLDRLARERSGYLAEREQELALLSDPALAGDLSERGWRLLGFQW